MSATAARVYWTDEERCLITRRCFHYQQHGFPLLSALTQAQLDLPESRRRHITSLATLPWLKGALRLLECEALQAPLPLSTRPMPRATELASPVQAADLPGEPGSSLLQALKGMIEEAVYQCLHQLFTETGLLPTSPEEKIGAEAASTAEPMTAHAPRRSETCLSPDLPASMPKVLIAGLIGSQIAEIKRCFGEAVDLRFWQSSESKDLLRQMARKSDVAIGVTSFIAHSTDASLKRLAPHYIRHPGGLALLKQKLTELKKSYCGSDAARAMAH